MDYKILYDNTKEPYLDDIPKYPKDIQNAFNKYILNKIIPPHLS